MRSLILNMTLAALATPLAAQATHGDGEPAVLAAVDRFHSALEPGDSTAALGQLHPDVVIFEGGYGETLAQYRAGHLRGDIAFASATDREIIDAGVTVWGDQALYTSTSRTTGQYRGREIDSLGTETVVLVRSPDGWRIRHIHWSSR